MKKEILFLFLLLFGVVGIKAQGAYSTLNWNTIQKTGFYINSGKEGSNSPVEDNQWWWGLSVGSSANEASGTYYNAQIAFANSAYPPKMYVRSTSSLGASSWARIIHDKGPQTIFGDITLSVSAENTVPGWGGMTTQYGSYAPKLYFGNMYDNLDPLWIARFNKGKDISELRVNVGDGLDPKDKFIVGTTSNVDGWIGLFEVAADGNVGIGVKDPQNRLEVKGTIRAEAVVIESGWADFVFDEGYKLPSLSEVEDHIKTYKHLPEIPSAKEVQEKGVDLGDIQTKLLQKIEELTLYTIQQQKQLDEQRVLIKELQQQVQKK